MGIIHRVYVQAALLLLQISGLLAVGTFDSSSFPASLGSFCYVVKKLGGVGRTDKPQTACFLGPCPLLLRHGRNSPPLCSAGTNGVKLAGATSGIQAPISKVSRKVRRCSWPLVVNAQVQQEKEVGFDYAGDAEEGRDFAQTLVLAGDGIAKGSVGDLGAYDLAENLMDVRIKRPHPPLHSCAKIEGISVWLDTDLSSICAYAGWREARVPAAQGAGRHLLARRLLGSWQ